MHKVFTLFLLLTLSCSGFSQLETAIQNQSQDILNLDVFKKEEEKKIFTTLASGKEVDYLSLFLTSDLSFQSASSAPASSSIEQIRSRVDSFVNTPEMASTKQNRSIKGLKAIYRSIHNAFLTQYQENPSFGQLFVDGNYNCATATALYALLLEKLSISYNIRETPDHVYLIAAPESANILFETTAPGARFYQLNEKARGQFVDYLYNNKMISKEEWTTGDKNQIFNKYYYADEQIDKRKLAGLLYYNLGIRAAASQDYREAYRNFEKSFFLYPVPKLKYFVSFSLANVLLEKGMLENETAYPYFLRFLQVNQTEAGRGMLTEYMENVTKKLLGLTKKGNQENMQRSTEGHKWVKTY